MDVSSSLSVPAMCYATVFDVPLFNLQSSQGLATCVNKSQPQPDVPVSMDQTFLQGQLLLISGSLSRTNADQLRLVVSLVDGRVGVKRLDAAWLRHAAKVGPCFKMRCVYHLD